VVLAAALSADPRTVEGIDGFLSAAAAVGQIILKVSEKISERPASPGYEPLLIQHGVHPVAARGLALLAVHYARQHAKDCKSERAVFEAIRFLGRPRQQRAVLARARVLLQAWEKTSILERIFDEAGLHEAEFIQLLQAVVNRKEFDSDRITTLVTAVTPRLTLSHGPKVTAPSRAFEFFATHWGIISGSANLRRAESRDYLDALTEATGREFHYSDFDSRSARRRLKVQRTAKRAVPFHQGENR
jgi:hypothetical protein